MIQPVALIAINVATLCWSLTVSMEQIMTVMDGTDITSTLDTVR